MASVEKAYKTPRLAFRLPLDPARLLRARERVRDYLHEHHADPQAIEDLVLALEEAMANVVRHSEAERDLEVTLAFHGYDLVMEVRDYGKGFDVDSFRPDVVPELLRSGGRGLFLISKLTDDLQLRRDGGLTVRAVKRDVLSQPGSSREHVPLEAAVPGSRAYQDERQRALLDEIDEGFVAFDWEFRFVYVNPAFCRLFGESEELYLGKTLWELFPYAADHPAARAYREAMELGNAAVLEYESPGAGGWIETRTYPNSSGISVYVRGIAERKRKERERDEFLEALEASETRHRELVQSANSAIMRWSRDGTITFFNEYAERLFGWTAEEAVGQPVDILVPERESTGADLTTLARDIVAHPDRYESNVNENIRRDGTRFWMTWTNRAVFDESGELVEVLAVGNDITELKRAEEALRASEERYRSIVELADEELIVQPDGSYSYQGAAAAAAIRPDEQRRFREMLVSAGAWTRRHRLASLVLAIVVELALLVPMGLAPTSRHVLGMPGSLLALTVVLIAVLAGWRIGVTAAVAGGVVFWATVADFGARSSPITTVVSTGIWAAAALVSGILADALRDQTRRRKSAAVALARAETRRQAEAAEWQRVEQLASDLRREREQLRAIIEHTDASIVFLDRDFNFLLVNSAYATTCGYSPDEIVGLNHFDLYPHKENEAIFRRVRDTGEAVEYLAKPFEFPDQPERGVTYWDWQLAPVKDDEGRVETLVFSLVEVTERIRSAMFGDALNAINAALAARLDKELHPQQRPQAGR